MLKLIRDVFLMYVVCYRYGIKLRFNKSEDYGCFEVTQWAWGSKTYTIECSLRSKNRMEIFFHEVGHFFFYKNKFRDKHLSNEEHCSEILSGLYLGWNTVEGVLYEEAFASAFSRRAMKSLGMMPDIKKLKYWFSTYTGPVFKALTDHSQHDSIPTTVDIIYKAIRRIEGV